MSAARQCIQETLDGAQMFRDFERSGFQLRNPATSTTGLLCLNAVGDCLNPIVVEGDLIYVERGATPEHGDLALIEWAPAVVASWFASERAESWAKRFGDIPMDRGLKLAWDFPQALPAHLRKRFWVCKDNMSRNAVALGVVRAIERNGVLLHGDIVHRPIVATAGIDKNAATDVAVSTAASTVLVSGANTAITSLTVGPLDGAATCVFTINAEYQFDTGAVADYLILRAGVWTTNPPPFKTVINTSSATFQASYQTTYGTFADEQSYSLAQGATVTVYFGVFGFAVQVGSTITILNASLKVEAIKL
jgi:hypothetical protein